MRVKDLKCYPQVVAVIGEAYTVHEFQRVIDSECEFHSSAPLIDAFAWDDTPQREDFWLHIEMNRNPYDHDHEKPEVKEWAYYGGECLARSGDYYSDSNGCGAIHKKEISGVGILDTHKSVTMPDWVPADLDNLDYAPEDVAFTGEPQKSDTLLSVGDKVKVVKTDQLKYNAGFNWIPEMDRYDGMEAYIVEVLDKGVYVLDIDNGRFGWWCNFLQPIKYNPEDVAFSAKLVPEKITLSEEDFDNFVNKCDYLPSLGEVCTVELGTGEFKVTIVGKKLNGCLIWECNNLTDAYRQPEEQVGKFSPYISEEDKVLQKASSIISNGCLTEELKMLYDAGMLRLPEGE